MFSLRLLHFSGQEQAESQKITVKGKEVNNGVVILAVQEGKNSFDLRCNKDISGCTVLEPGEYMMVRLPKNRGLYDCANAEVYRKPANPKSETSLASTAWWKQGDGSPIEACLPSEMESTICFTAWMNKSRVPWAAVGK